MFDHEAFGRQLREADRYWTVDVNGVTHKFLEEWKAQRFQAEMSVLYGRDSSLVGLVTEVRNKVEVV